MSITLKGLHPKKTLYCPTQNWWHLPPKIWHPKKVITHGPDSTANRNSFRGPASRREDTIIVMSFLVVVSSNQGTWLCGRKVYDCLYPELSKYIIHNPNFGNSAQWRLIMDPNRVIQSQTRITNHKFEQTNPNRGRPTRIAVHKS